jgi:hypothetical protein
MEKRTKTWLSIVGAVLGVMLILMVTAVGGAAYWVYSHVQSQTVAQEAAGDRFARVRQQLAGKQPLIEIVDRNEVVLHRSATPPPASERLQTLHALVYDTDEQKLLDVHIPFWLLRLAPSGGRFSFLNDNGIDINSDRINVTVADLERHGPGLIMDHHDRHGSLVLVWSE